MKLICSKQNLLYGVNIVSKAVPTRTTMAILECILIDASANEIKLTANDMAGVKEQEKDGKQFVEIGMWVDQDISSIGTIYDGVAIQ